MALTQAMLKAMGIEDEKRDQIMEAHQGVLESIKKERDELREQAAKVPSLEKKIEEMEAAKPTEDWEAKYEAVKADYEDFKAKVEQQRADDEKARLYRSMLREQGVDEKRIESIMKVTDLTAVGVKDGAITDPETVAEAIKSEWGDFITQTSSQGAVVDNPPTNTGAKRSREDIMAIKNTDERQRAIAENMDLFKS